MANIKSRVSQYISYALRRWEDTSQCAKWYIYLLLFQVFAVIGMEAGLIGIYAQRVHDLFRKDLDRGIPVYFLMFLASQLFSLYLALDSIWRKNAFQIIGFVIFSVCVFGWSIFQYFQVRGIDVPLSGEYDVLGKITDDPDNIWDKMAPLMIAVSVVTGAFSVAWVYFARRLISYFGWEVYRKIGADIRLRKMYRSYQILLLLLKMDAFAFIGFAVQFIIVLQAKDTSDPEYGLTIAAVPLTLIVLMLAVVGLRKENRAIMWCFVIGLCCSIAYFLFKVGRMYTKDQAYKYKDMRPLLTFFAAVSMATTLATLFMSIVCMTNFDRGLRDHVHHISKTHKQPPLRMATISGMKFATGNSANHHWSGSTAHDVAGPYDRIQSPPRLDLDI
ncbi:hypothetical protein EV182_003917 [Spiromyces aspiralis]|uniref:Uncharacterized protein n=1 Tax=Spiromyces aspiralis TaxID=68401 RepID=A0ACC1HGA3_9FUNG|nr:hypothetical protein EV182_003917 [Spiromyces aspiralis]